MTERSHPNPAPAVLNSSAAKECTRRVNLQGGLIGSRQMFNNPYLAANIGVDAAGKVPIQERYPINYSSKIVVQILTLNTEFEES